MFIFAAALCATAHAGPITILPATFSGSAAGSQDSGPTPTLSGPGTITNTGCPAFPGDCGTASFTIAYAPGDVTMSTTASTVGGPNALAIAGGSAEFFFYVTGPGNAPVPLIFSATGTTSVTGGQAYGQVEVVSPGGGLNACSATGPYASTCSNVPQPSAFSSALPFSLAPNALSDVTITIACNLETTGTCAASVDPMIEIDPTFVDASQYTLVFSPAVGGTGAPEAASLAMLGIGGLVFVGMYKRKVST